MENRLRRERQKQEDHFGGSDLAPEDVQYWLALGEMKRAQRWELGAPWRGTFVGKRVRRSFSVLSLLIQGSGSAIQCDGKSGIGGIESGVCS